MLWQIALRFLSPIDAERLHRLSFGVLRAIGRRPTLLQLASGVALPSTNAPIAAPSPTGFPMLFPLGLAAGFDKNAEILDLLPGLGFGFAEIGTVTPRPQAGNPKPRLHRNYRQQLVFNRMGFNNDGADAVAWRVEAHRERLPPGFGVGVNLGKNKETPETEAARDYAFVAARFAGLADYFVVNVSSPNTPGLRELQKPERLVPILAATKAAAASAPVFIKLAPEIAGEELASLVALLDREGADGFVLGNTLGGDHAGMPGGWSGSILTERARANLATAASVSKRPLISVGGILDEAEARARMDAGASAIQIYTGWVTQGPRFPARLRSALQAPSRAK